MKLPRKIKHWADETLNAYMRALVLFEKEYPNPTEAEYMSIISFAVPMAAVNRGISDRARRDTAQEFVLSRLAESIRTLKEDEKPDFSILFPLAYLDAHVSMGILNERKSDEIIAHLMEKYSDFTATK